jgi:hypothetical protein
VIIVTAIKAVGSPQRHISELGLVKAMQDSPSQTKSQAGEVYVNEDIAARLAINVRNGIK